MNKKRLLTLLGGSKKVAWYLASTVALTDWIGVYQAIGANSLAESYLNLANPGTYDLTVTTAPLFAKATGWQGTGTQFLKTGILPKQNYTYIIRYSNVSAAAKVLIGQYESQSLLLSGNYVNGVCYANGSNNLDQAPAVLTGVIAVAGGNCYRNGVAEGTTINNNMTSTSQDVYILARNNNGSVDRQASAYVQAVAIANRILTATEILETTNALNLLSEGSRPF
jgi:hypothetical protein